jgi:hypothetical protein
VFTYTYCSVLIGLFTFFYWVVWISYRFWILTACQMYSLEIFHLFCRVISLICFLCCEELFSLMPFHLCISAFVSYVLGILSPKFLSIPMSWSIFHLF